MSNRLCLDIENIGCIHTGKNKTRNTGGKKSSWMNVLTKTGSCPALVITSNENTSTNVVKNSTSITNATRLKLGRRMR